jgi:hypothetical protein
MSAYNVVRFRVKPGREQEFVAAHRNISTDEFGGLIEVALVDTGERTFCFVGKWQSFDDIVAARPAMIALLDSYRDMLEDLGVTDPVSGTAVVEV